MVSISAANENLRTGPPLCREPIETVEFGGRDIDGGQRMSGFHSARHRKVSGSREAISFDDLALDFRGEIAELYRRNLSVFPKLKKVECPPEIRVLALRFECHLGQFCVQPCCLAVSLKLRSD